MNSKSASPAKSADYLIATDASVPSPAARTRMRFVPDHEYDFQSLQCRVFGLVAFFVYVLVTTKAAITLTQMNTVTKGMLLSRYGTDFQYELASMNYELPKLALEAPGAGAEAETNAPDDQAVNHSNDAETGLERVPVGYQNIADQNTLVRRKGLSNILIEGESKLGGTVAAPNRKSKRHRKLK